ncbi:MAG TPA: inositol monophosphatase family protein [Candidatus Dormibacteraeota bacterium]|nr:inositol monophosphatase family protein [Candidatus Dormibacteraeota bacterium]
MTPESEAAAADHSRELAFATALAERAGTLLVERFEKVEHIDYKSAKDVVTEVDRLSEELIIGAIRATYPGDGIIAEESGEHASGAGDAPSGGIGRAWVVDPLDGTINYANGIPFFCVAIALVEAGVPVVGVIHDPIRGETFAATSAGPATLAGRTIRASVKTALTDYVVSMALSGRALIGRSRAVRKAVRVPRAMGSAALSLAYVGNGRFDAFVQQGGLSTWDVAAAGLIAERGGARLTDLEGGPWFNLSRPTRSIGVLAAPAAHHAALLEIVRGPRG